MFNYILTLLINCLFIINLNCDLVTINKPALRGALVDEYSPKALIIKIKSPTDVIKDTMHKLDFEKMDKETGDTLKLVLGDIEGHYQHQFVETLPTYQELITTPYYPVTEGDNGNGKIININNINKRVKRNPLRFLLSLLRVVRPIARIGGKLTKYGKFMKTLKYAGYAASAGIFTYELADIFGAFPDHKYDELTRELNEIHANRILDLKVMKNITLLTTNTNAQILDLTKSVNDAIATSNDKFEIRLKISQIFSSYLQQLGNSLILLFLGKLPTSIVSLELQRSWLEKSMPIVLLNEISSISPHLKLNLKAIDEVNHQLVLLVEVPRVDSRFQLLNYVEWEPKIIQDDVCYTSPVPSLYLAYKTSVQDGIINDPLVINPSSCQRDGFIMCESDSIIDVIPELTVNQICTRSLKTKNIRKKRDLDDLFVQANAPIYNIEQILNKTITQQKNPEKTKRQLSDLNEEIEKLIKDANKRKLEYQEMRDEADKADKFIKGLTIFCSGITIVLIYFLAKLIKKKLSAYKQQKIDERNLRLR